MAIVVIVAVLVALLAAIGGALLLFFRRPLPQTEGVLHVPGLEGRVEVVRDEWGVPHLYAGSSHDLFFAQGYVHAQDRLWQMELQRRAGSGRLSEVLGEVTLEVDRLFRTIGLNRAAEAEFEALDAETRSALEAYAAGVNAYLTSARGRRPAEFKLLRFDPEPWHAVDGVYWAKVMAWNLGCNWSSELIRARLAAKLGADLAADLEPLFPADNPSIVHTEGVAEGVALPPNGWRSQALRDALRQVESLLQSQQAPAATCTPIQTGAGGGSNQWVVAGGRSASGKPLLANDTHMQLQIPAIWYQVHLEGGGYHVTGVSLPGLPGVVVGHNERCAWGMTTAWQDVQDLYIERLNPDNSHQYEYKGAWLDAAVVREEIRVKGRAEAVIQEVVITRHGPIISGLVGETTPLALRWVASEPGNLLGSVLRYDRAQNWAEFRAALEGWSTPAHNYVYADVDGNIGFLQAGWVPLRAGKGGLAPVPGWTGEHEWQGYLPLDELPQAYNPESGWLATANNLVVDAGYPHYLSSDLENPCRAQRIADLLGSQPTFTADDFSRFQRDTYSAQAERFVGYLLAAYGTTPPGMGEGGLTAESDAERCALEYLKEWDYHLELDSIAASLYQVTRLRALHLVFDPHLGELADLYVGLGLPPAEDVSPYHARSFVRLLDLLQAGQHSQDDELWLRDPASGQVRSCQALLRQALQEAIGLLEKELGPEMARWQWGRLNKVHFAHPVGSVKPLHLIFNRGPYPLAGDQDTLLRARGTPRFPFPPASVVDALRFIADLSDWEKCRIVIPGGQSGHVASPHYADLITVWLEGRFQPMPFAREQVERHACQRLELVP